MMVKTGEFETDVCNGYYRWERNNSDQRTFSADFAAWLLTQGVPAQYVDKVAWVAYDQGHAYGEESVVSASHNLISIFQS
jgi:hypothetical protein